MKLTRYAEGLFRRALAHVDVTSSIRARVRSEGDRLYVDERHYPLSSYERIGVIAIGKAGLPMSEAVLDILQGDPASAAKIEGVVVGARVPSAPRRGFTYFVGSHPLPNATSLAAADSILGLLSGFGANGLVIFLISGGASAMVERALDPQLSPEDTFQLYRELLQSGLPITEMNCVRKHLSATKGGRLALAAAGATQISLLVSDVPGDDMSVIGSGPSVPDPSTAEQCAQILEQLRGRHEVPAELNDRLCRFQVAETPKPSHAAFARSFSTCVLSPADLLARTASIAAQDGFYVEIDNRCDDWHYRDAAEYLLKRVQLLHQQHGRVCVLSGGELSVPLPADAGTGGRNQQFALTCALQLRNCADNIAVLSAGTDGADGNSPAAGAVVDGSTCDQAAALGLNAADFYSHFDSYTLFRAIGAAIITGPTENNLRDLRILVADE